MVKSFVCLLLSIVLSSQALAARSCQGLFTSQSFSFAKFEEHRSYLVSAEGQAEDAIGPDGQVFPEHLLAILEASAERHSIAFRPLDAEIVARYSQRLLDGRYSQASQFSNLVEDLYRRRIDRGHRLLRVPSVSLAIRERIEIELLRSDLMESIRRLGLLEDPTAMENFRRFRERNWKLETTAIAGSLNAISFAVLGSPLYSPKTQFLKAKTIPPGLLEKIRRDGLEKHWHEARSTLALPATLDVSSLLVRRAFMVTMLAIAGYFLWNAYPEIRNGFVRAQMTEEALMRHQQATFDRDTVIGEQLKSWSRSIELLDNRTPTEVEVAEKLTELRSRTDEDLQAYRKN